MSKKDKKIEIQIADAKVSVNNVKLDGYSLSIGKKAIGEIAELDDQFVIVKDGIASSFHKKLEAAVAVIVEEYNLNR
ncbi:DUF2969 domain-containing protein [Streptococcus loxodontisalivarius]|uniref:DUF2969 domain-containing protein n=1 Tax=Streptococcus loxodontisalivarius TaxID=1349415 RepID=A0ABS2PP50_9STRE|nr:DUF2969 domain-containing protein [Streptococcus loxodontisalivarius]MBM7641804.1 hypothetical protein [Streptococcus loxodontisalivarius]